MWILMSRYIGFMNVSDEVTHILFMDPDDRFFSDEWISEWIKNPKKIIEFNFYCKYVNKKNSSYK